MYEDVGWPPTSASQHPHTWKIWETFKKKTQGHVYIILCFVRKLDRDGRVKNKKNQRTNKRKTKPIDLNKFQHEGNKKDANNKIRQASTCKDKTAKKTTNDIAIVITCFKSQFLQQRKPRCDDRQRISIFYNIGFGTQRLRSHAASPVRCNSTVTRNVVNYFRLVKCRTC